MQPLVLKYQPKRLVDVKGQEKAITILKNYVTNYKTQKKKAVLVHGPIGCGKTCTVYALAKENNAEIIEMNSSDLRNEAAMNSTVGEAMKQQSLFFRSKIILIDEIDTVSRKDRGCATALSKLIQDSSYPVILTANDAYHHSLKTLRKSVEIVEFEKLNYSVIAQVLKEICEKEQIGYEEKAINSLARIADGDLRGALIDLQILAFDKKLDFKRLESLDDRKKTENIFNMMRLIFKASTVDNSLSALDNLNIPINEVFLWLDENLPKEYTEPQALCSAYQQLSRADIFNRRIMKQQHWRFLVYINNFLTAGITASKTSKNPAFVKYGPTTRILKLWRAKMKNAQKKDIAAKIAAKTHSSRKQVLDNFEYFKVIFSNSKQQDRILEQFDLSAEEVAWLKK
ncbi:MAG: replication factor C large subunit [Candidatus Woesearchaeota archaeon]